MYGNNVGVGGITAGTGGSVLPATGGPDSIWFWIAVGCIVVGIFAMLMSTGALWRIVPARLRRGLAQDRAASTGQ